jgi:hypothetical protein
MKEDREVVKQQVLSRGRSGRAAGSFLRLAVTAFPAWKRWDRTNRSGKEEV